MGSKIIILIFIGVIIILDACLEKSEKNEINAKNYKATSIDIGMNKILEEVTLNGEKYTTVLIGEGFNDKVFFIALFKGDIKYRSDGYYDTDKAILYKYVDLKEIEIEYDKFRPTRFPESSKIDITKKELLLLFDNGDIDIYYF